MSTLFQRRDLPANSRKRLQAGRPGPRQAATKRKKLGADVLPPDLVGTLTVADKAVAAVIASTCRMSSNSCTKAVATIAEEAFVSTRTVQLALKHLDDAELIVCLHRRRAAQAERSEPRRDRLGAMAGAPRKRALLAQLDRVQKCAGKKGNNNYPSNFTPSTMPETARQWRPGPRRKRGDRERRGLLDRRDPSEAGAMGAMDHA